MIRNLKKHKVQEGVFFIIFFSLVIKKSLEYHKYGGWSLSPALVPIGVSLLIILLSIILIIQGMKKDIVVEDSSFSDRWKNPLLVLSATIVLLVVLPIVHFLISAILYLVCMLLILGERNVKIIGLISVVSPLLIYVLFDVLLSVRLP